MTFDEALEQVDALGSSWLGGRFDHWTPDEVRSLIRKLQESYAPTIELTQSQLDEFEADDDEDGNEVEDD